MKDVSTTLRTAYFTAITSLTDLNGNTVPLYDKVPSDAGNKYVHFNGFNTVEWTDKSKFGSEVVITLNVVCQYNMNQGGQKEVDFIGNQVIGFIRTRSVLDLSPDFQMVTVEVDSIVNSSEGNEGGTEFIKSISFRHKIKEIN